MTDERPNTVDINYIKSSRFIEISCDGAIGGPTPKGKLWLAFYTERLPLPRVVRHELKVGPDGVEPDPDKAVLMDGREGVVRNVEVGVYLTAQTAADLRDWLNEQLKKLAGEGNE
jgi:hypothetical protein